jgi:hypothetical protein
MIVSGGVNIYPQEIEDVLVIHPDVADVAVFGVPNADLGEEVKAVVQLQAHIEPSERVAMALLGHSALHLARFKVPRSIDFIEQLPRLPTRELYKRLLRERYWEGHQSPHPMKSFSLRDTISRWPNRSTLLDGSRGYWRVEQADVDRFFAILSGSRLHAGSPRRSIVP